MKQTIRSRLTSGILTASLLGLAGCSKPVNPDRGFASNVDFGAVWGTSATDVYAVGLLRDSGGWKGLLGHFDGHRWAITNEAQDYFTGMCGTSVTEQCVVGFHWTDKGTILLRRYQGGRWNTTTSHVGVELFGVWGSSPSDVFAVGSHSVGNSGAIYHYDGSAWTAQNDTLQARAVWGSSGSDVFVVGESILHYDGHAWSTQMDRAGFLVGIWGSSGSDVFAVGGSGTVLHYDGHQWTSQASPTREILTHVWGASASDVFAVGTRGTIIHFDGQHWTAMDSGTSADLGAVWGSSGTNVYAAGYGGTLRHFDGTGWSAVTW